jgi:KDO2-lipid IV(A) lauroyltransferase
MVLLINNIIAERGIKEPVRKIRAKEMRRAIYGILPIPFSLLFKYVPEGLSFRIAKILGHLSYYLLNNQRKIAISNLRMAYRSEKGEEEIQRIAKGVFVNIAMNLIEFFRIERLGPHNIDNYVKAEGLYNLDLVQKEGRGGIYITGHIGNWELQAVYLALKGYPVNVIARRIYVDSLNKMLVNIRKSKGVNVLYRDRDQKEMLRRLRNNEFVGILPDQEVRRLQGIFVDFFGRPCYTPIGPIILALHADSPIIMGRILRKGNYHLLKVDPPVYIERTGSKGDIIKRYTYLYTKRLEDFIREDPSQWVWMHRRWRTSPEYFKNEKNIRSPFLHL